MQAALADQRAAEAAIEKQREFHAELSEALSRACRARYYELGAEVTRAEQSIRYTRELRERARDDLAQVNASLGTNSRSRSCATRSSSRRCARSSPSSSRWLAARSARARQPAGAALAAAEQQLADWQQRWESFNRELGAAGQSAEVERARIEQLESQLHRLQAQADRLSARARRAQRRSRPMRALDGARASRRRGARAPPSTLAGELDRGAGAGAAAARRAAAAPTSAAGAARREREQARAELTVARGAAEGGAAREAPRRRRAGWRRCRARRTQPRLAQTLEVERGLGARRRNGARRLSGGGVRRRRSSSWQPALGDARRRQRDASSRRPARAAHARRRGTLAAHVRGPAGGAARCSRSVRTARFAGRGAAASARSSQPASR